jgi:hypothetical protein
VSQYSDDTVICLVLLKRKKLTQGSGTYSIMVSTLQVAFVLHCVLPTAAELDHSETFCQKNVLRLCNILNVLMTMWLNRFAFDAKKRLNNKY